MHHLSWDSATINALLVSFILVRHGHHPLRVMFVLSKAGFDGGEREKATTAVGNSATFPKSK